MQNKPIGARTTYFISCQEFSRCNRHFLTSKTAVMTCKKCNLLRRWFALMSLLTGRFFAHNWKRFSGIDRKNNSGRKPFDVVVMFKILILQSLYNLSDAQIEFQIRDRMTFMKFLGLSWESKVPDEKTVWLFRDQLTKAGLIKPLFDRFESLLVEQGFEVKRGQMVDATIVNAPIQHNSKEENEQVKAGEIPEDWSEPKQRQKDTDARFTKKRKKTFYGYKNHANVDVEYKIIRDFGTWVTT